MATNIFQAANLDEDRLETYSAVWSRIGNTPLARLTSIANDLPDTVELYAKLEWENPSGSVKDRPAAEILRQALAQGEFEGQRMLLDSTSGNMGIAYATLCAALGQPVHLVVPANASPERLTILRALGAHITLSDPLEGSEGARTLAEQMAAEEPGRYYYANQYDNPANWLAHYRSTGPEILMQTNNRVTHVVAGLGTTGTLTGIGRYLQETLPEARLVGVQPDGPFHGLEGLKHLPSSDRPGIFDPTLISQMESVATEEAYGMLHELARREGLMVGVSSAAALVAALRVARSIRHGVVVVIFPDSAAKYLSQPFWREK
jgi:cysteine synthase B